MRVNISFDDEEIERRARLIMKERGIKGPGFSRLFQILVREEFERRGYKMPANYPASLPKALREAVLKEGIQTVENLPEVAKPKTRKVSRARSSSRRTKP